MPRRVASFSSRTRRNGSSSSPCLPIAGFGMSSAAMITPYPRGRACPGHPRLKFSNTQQLQDVDARDKPGQGDFCVGADRLIPRDRLSHPLAAEIDDRLTEALQGAWMADPDH